MGTSGGNTQVPPEVKGTVIARLLSLQPAGAPPTTLGTASLASITATPGEDVMVPLVPTTAEGIPPSPPWLGQTLLRKGCG